MAITFTLAVGQVSAGNFVPDESMDGTINLRVSPYASAAYTGTHIDDGVYSFGSVAIGEYKVYNSGTELTSFGIIKIGEDDAVMLTGAQTIADVKTFSGQPVLSAGVKTDTISENSSATGVTIDGILLKDNLTTSNIVNINGTQTITGAKTMSNLIVPTPSTSASVMDRGASDTRYIQKESGATAQQVYAQVILRTLPYLIDDPTHAMHATNRLFVENYCTALLSSLNPTAYQQSGNIIRLIPSGVQETNKVYKTLALSLANAESFAASDRIMIIEFHGNGTGSTEANYSLLPVGTAEDYINIIGIGQVNVRVAEDVYDGTAGRTIYANLNFDNEAEDAQTDFTNKIFYNCKFSNTFGSGTPVYNFTGCIFIGCSITTTYTFTTCKGDIIDLANDYNIILGNLRVGAYSVIDTNADVRPRRLQGRQGADIASASSITLGNGNYFVITGTTTIATISGTSWEDGSVVYLYCTSAVTFDTGGGNIVRNTGGGGNLAAGAGQVVSFIRDASSWIILES